MSLKSSLDNILLHRFETCYSANSNNGRKAPGIQVALVGSQGTILYEGAIGYSNGVVSDHSKKEQDNNIDSNTAAATTTTTATTTTRDQANLYSVSKFLTASCVLKLVQEEKIQATDPVSRYLPPELQEVLKKHHWDDFLDSTIEDLVAHQAGVPNPLPLTWVHTPKDDPIDELKYLMRVISQNKFPNAKRMKNKEQSSSLYPFQYSNIGYWMLSFIVTSVCNNDDFTTCCHQLLSSDDNNNSIRSITNRFVPNVSLMYGHVPRWSPLALAAHWFCPKHIMGPKNKEWIRMEPHYLNGTGFGGFIASSRNVATFLGNFILPFGSKDNEAKILSESSIQRLWTPINQKMTFGLHIRKHRGVPIFHKEGGGAGCHSTIQFRPNQQVAGCLIASDAALDVNALLEEIMDGYIDTKCSTTNRMQTHQIQQKTKMVVSFDGTKLHTKEYFIISDNNPPSVNSAPFVDDKAILLIHGGPGVPWNYLEELVILLLEYKIATRIIVYDQRGVGLSSTTPQNNNSNPNFYSIESHLKDVDQIRHSYQLPSIHIMGHSWGGVLAQLYHQHYPNKVSSMVLLSPTTVSITASALSNNKNVLDWSTMEQNVMAYNFRKCNSYFQFLKLGLYSLGIHLPFVSNCCCQKLFTMIIKNYYFDPTSAPLPNQEILNGISATCMMESKRAFLEYTMNNTATAAEPAATKTISSSNSLCIFGHDDIYGTKCMNTFCKSVFQGRSIILPPISGHLSWIDQPKILVNTLISFYQEQKNESNSK